MANAYAFNPDRSKAPVYTKDEIDQALAQEVADRQAGDTALGARVDNILAEQDLDPNKDSELVDIRTGYDGTVYASAGGAVRDQVKRLSVLNGVLTFNKSDLTAGYYIKDDGTLAQTQAMGYSDFIPLPDDVKSIQINCHGNFTAPSIVFYKNNSGYTTANKVGNACPAPGNYAYGENVLSVTAFDIPSEAKYVAFTSCVDTTWIYDFHAQINFDFTLTKTKSEINRKLGAIAWDDSAFETLLTEYGYLSSDGTYVYAADWVVSEYIEISDYFDYIHIGHCYPLGGTNLNLAFYKDDLTFISGINTSNGGYNSPVDVAIPANAKYFRIGTHKYEQYYHYFSMEIKYKNFVLYTIKAIDSLNDGKDYQRIDGVMAPLVLGTEHLNVKLIGDSITAGVGGTDYDASESGGGDWIYQGYYENVDGYCWANLLRDYFEEKFNCTVHNFGMSGRKSGHLLQGISAWLHADDDIVICMIGTNDRNLNETDPISGEASTQATFYANMTSLVNQIQSQGKKIILMANIPAYNENNPNFHMEDVDHIIMKVATEHNMEYVSVYKLMMEYCKYTGTTLNSLLADGLHPNDAGYLVMFRLITNALGISAKREDANW